MDSLDATTALTQLHHIMLDLVSLGPVWVAVGFAATLALGGLRVLGR